jgi:hypothetical protein
LKKINNDDSTSHWQCFAFCSPRGYTASVPVVLFCQCGSDRVDIKLWNNRRVQLQCFSCGHEAWLEGFTVSEFDPAKLLTAAVIDQARKHRRRPPDEVRRIEEHRKTRSR